MGTACMTGGESAYSAFTGSRNTVRGGCYMKQGGGVGATIAVKWGRSECDIDNPTSRLTPRTVVSLPLPPDEANTAAAAIS